MRHKLVRVLLGIDARAINRDAADLKKAVVTLERQMREAHKAIAVVERKLGL